MSYGFAESNRAAVRYVAEDPAAWGVTPVNGVVREVRLTESSIKPSKDTKTSQELRSDRMVPSIIEVGAKTDGDIKFELSSGAMDDFLAAFVYGLWSRPMGQDKFAGYGVTVIDADTFGIQGDVRPYFTAGRRIKSEGFLANANNSYATVVSTTFDAGTNVTSVNVSGVTLVPEVGSLFTKIMDANDVLVFKNTAVRFGTGGASTIDSAGTNAFAAAVAAGQLKVGQKIFVEGPFGLGVGTVTVAAVPAAGTQLVINDGLREVVFQYGGVPLPGVRVIEPAADANGVAANLAAVVSSARAEGSIEVKAVAATGVVTLTNLKGAGGSVVEKADTGAALAVVSFAGGDNSLRGLFTLTSVSADVLGVLPKPTTNANAGAVGITVKASMLRNPSVVTDFVKQSFSMETSYEDIGQHFVSRGMRVGTFDLDVQAGELVSGTVSFMGSETKRSAVASLRGGAYTNLKAPEYEVMNATSNVGQMVKNGRELATALKSISLKGDGKLREQRKVGSKFAAGIGVGRFELKGTVEAYFETGELFDEFINHETVSLGFGFTDGEGTYFAVTLPAVKFTSDPISPGKLDEDVMEKIDFEAQRDPATSTMIQFDRFSSIKAPTA